jgi:hypothetical protein
MLGPLLGTISRWLSGPVDTADSLLIEVGEPFGSNSNEIHELRPSDCRYVQ